MASAEEQEPKMPEQVPVTVITGFLGAGKTTLLNHILTDMHGYKFAVIENEFGEIGIDSELVQDAKQSAEEIVNLDNGCLCCTVREDLIKTVKQLLQRLAQEPKKFDAIIIETTGMADPGPIVQTFYRDPILHRACKIDGILTVVDAKHIGQNVNDTREEGAVNEAQQQLAFADRIILNKCDLVDPKDLPHIRAEIRSVNKDAEIVEAVKAKVDAKNYFGMDAFNLDKLFDLDPEFKQSDIADKNAEHKHAHDHDHDHDHDHKHDHDHDHDHKCGSDCKDPSHKHDHDHDHKHDHDHDHDHKHAHDHDHDHNHDHDHKCGADCNDPSHHHDDHDHADHKCGEGCTHDHHHHETKKIHDKAISSVGVKVADDVDVRMLERWVGQLLQEYGPKLYRYKGILSVKGQDRKFVFQGVHELFDGDFSDTLFWKEGEKRECKFVFIGKDLDRKSLEDGFKECVAKPLRFAVGTKVLALVKGGFKAGTVIKHWDNGNPYRIRLDTGTEVWGPLDQDVVVKLQTEEL